jgi:hypothetical protein
MDDLPAGETFPQSKSNCPELAAWGSGDGEDDMATFQGNGRPTVRRYALEEKVTAVGATTVPVCRPLDSAGTHAGRAFLQGEASLPMPKVVGFIDANKYDVAAVARGDSRPSSICCIWAQACVTSQRIAAR